MEKSFVAALDKDTADAVIVQGMINVAHGLTMTVVAQGIETEAGRRMLNALGHNAAERRFDADAIAGRKPHGRQLGNAPDLGRAMPGVQR